MPSQPASPEPSPPAAPSTLPEVFGRYHIRQPLGGGGWGRVYLAHDTILDRLVALKIPHFPPGSGPEFLQRFAAHDPGSERFFKRAKTPGKQLFDLPRFVLWRLEQAGVGEAEWLERDTCADETLFFSNRRAFQRGEADYGRLLSAIAIA